MVSMLVAVIMLAVMRATIALSDCAANAEASAAAGAAYVHVVMPATNAHGCSCAKKCCCGTLWCGILESLYYYWHALMNVHPASSHKYDVQDRPMNHPVLHG